MSKSRDQSPERAQRKAYIVVSSEDYEGSSILDVFTNIQAARDYLLQEVQHYKASRTHRKLKDEKQSPDYWSGYSHQFEVEEWPMYESLDVWKHEQEKERQAKV